MDKMMNRSGYLKEILNNEEVKKLVVKYQLKQADLDKGFNTLLAYDLYQKKCLNCQGLACCKQLKKGYEPQIDYNGVNFDLDYRPCSYKQEQLNQAQLANNLVCYSCNLEHYNFNDIYINEKRKNVLATIKVCLNNYKNNRPTKGLYLHGKYGCGKTYLLAYLAKNLANANHQVIFAYYPDLVRTIKSSIATGELESIVEKLKEVEVLVLDDFGGEMLTGFIRDEVLGVILQDRMTNHRLTFMSSNMDQKVLLEHLKESNKDTDALRASRIYERIRTLMDFVELDDQNYRD